MKRPMQRPGSWRVLARAASAVALAALGACGGGTASPDGDGSGGDAASGGTSSGGTSSGGAVGSGGAASGGTPSGGAGGSDGAASGGTSSGGASSGGASSGGASSGGAAGSGGAAAGGSQGTGGLPGICSCEAAEVPVCGVDGETYSIACGEVCVPVEIACSGACPCDPNAGCGCTAGLSPVCESRLMWECTGQDFDLTEAVDQGCEDTGMSAIRYCCPYSVRAEAFCPD